MDINYILRREQTSLHNAAMASSSCARASHLGLAAAYGRLLADSTFPHRPPLQPRSVVVGEGGVGRQGRDGAPSLIVETAAAEAYLLRAPTASHSHVAAVADGRDRAGDQPAQAPRHGDISHVVEESADTILASRFAAGYVSGKSFQSLSRFVRQDLARLSSPDIDPWQKVS